MDAVVYGIGRQFRRRLELEIGLVADAGNERLCQLLEHCSDEAIYAAQICAVILSLVNLQKSEGRVLCPPGFELYEPGDFSALSALIEVRNTGLFSDRFVSAYRGLRHYLDVGRGLVPAFLNQSSPARYPAAKDVDELVVAIQTAAVFCDLLLGELALRSAELTDQASSAQLNDVRMWLERVRYGENICIRGPSIALPEIFLRAERGESQRVPVALPATLICGDMIRDVTVRDISVGGCRLDGVARLARGAKVEVSLPYERGLYGEVRWADGDAAGIKFFERLKTDDPLLRGNSAAPREQMRGPAEPGAAHKAASR